MNVELAGLVLAGGNVVALATQFIVPVAVNFTANMSMAVIGGMSALAVFWRRHRQERQRDEDRPED
ncbi:hypothetical protein GCM10009557_00050 [Virgisporangium ochraceum]|uniref:Uncharacterized protein n=1 Tax=Virgisporangium ochraceum TaxID=65505 RepID=A0A8J4EJ86_9ACTN|nr:hypothetical protein Voc01_089540 [Virgisporangium ochraceum]